MFKIASLIFIAFFVQVAHSETAEGQCGELNVKPVVDIDIAKYKGEWIGDSKTPFPTNNNLKCNNAGYLWTSGTTFITKNRGLNEQTNQIVTNEWETEIIPPGLLVKFQKNAGPKINYLCVGTDYTSYSAVTGCQNLNATHYDIFHFCLTREITPGTSVTDNCRKAFEASGVDYSTLIPNDHSNCPPEVYTA